MESSRPSLTMAGGLGLGVHFRAGRHQRSVREILVFPERGNREKVMELLQRARPEMVRRVLQMLSEEGQG